MSILKNYKQKFSAFLLIIPTLLIIGLFIPNVQAGPYVPEDHPNNEWHWEVDEGDTLILEGEFIITNYTSGDVIMMFRDIWIYNITSIANVTTDYLGTHEFSQVMATQCYYNVTAVELQAYGPSEEIALFGYNSTDTIKHKIRAGRSGLPYILPINGSNGLEVDILAPIINDSLYNPIGNNNTFNLFDSYTPNSITNRIYFSNSTDGYFSEGYYYDNGTMNTASAYLMANIDGPMLINATMKQVFDYDITNEVEWSVDVGNKFYYDYFEGVEPDDTIDIMAEVTSISEVLCEKDNNGFMEDPVQMVYQAVFADIYGWNGTAYELDGSNFPIGMANNFYPQYFNNEPSLFNILYPSNSVLEDYKFMWNEDTLPILNAPFDEIVYIENGELEVILSNSTGPDLARSVVDTSTGVVQSMLMKSDDDYTYYEIKSSSDVDWYYDPGDVIYLKNNDREHFRDLRVTLEATSTLFMNMSELFEDLNLMGIPVTLPSSQPELQFFSCIFADIQEWDSSTYSWLPDKSDIFAIANIYWPISPLSFEFGPPVLMPESTTADELRGIFDVFGTNYDDITENPGHITLRNTALDRELNFHFDSTTGVITMMEGWVIEPGPGSDWSYMSLYPKFYKQLSTGPNSFTLNSDHPPETTVDVAVNVGVGASPGAFIYNYFTMSPVNATLPTNVTVLGYVDMLFTNPSIISGNITMTINLPSSVDLNDMAMLFYGYNMSGTDEWDLAPPEFYLHNAIFDNVTNSIILSIEPWDEGIIAAIAYISVEGAGGIPGYDLFLLGLTIIIMSALAVRKMQIRKKII